MIFAKVDVCIVTHPKFCEAGMAAVGYWVGALAYSCGQELDGKLPSQAIGLILGVGRRRGRATCERLVSVGMFERLADGYAIVKFAQKNSTKEQIDARRRDNSERIAAFRMARAKPKGPGNTDCPENPDSGSNALHAPERELVVPGSGSGSRSNSRSGSGSKSEDLRSDRRAIGPEATAILAVIAPGLRLTSDARTTAEMLGVRDVEGEWVKFVAHHRGKGTVATDFHALWPKWAVMARDYERRDRERDAQRSGRRGQETRPAPYHANGSRRRVDVDIGAQLEARLEAEKPSKPAGDP